MSTVVNSKRSSYDAKLLQQLYLQHGVYYWQNYVTLAPMYGENEENNTGHGLYVSGVASKTLCPVRR